MLKEGIGKDIYHTQFRTLSDDRWMSPDPKESSFPGRSPYISMGGNPIKFIDPFGDNERTFVDYETGEELGVIDDGVDDEIKETVRITENDFNKLNELYEQDIANEDKSLTLFNQMITRYSLGKEGYDIAQTALSYEGSQDWDYRVAKGNFPKNTYKCNKFVQDVLSENDAEPEGTWPPLAGSWANPNAKIENWSIVKVPNLGDVIAGGFPYTDASGHVVIVTGIDFETGYIQTMGTVNSQIIGDNGFGNSLVNYNGNFSGKVYNPISIRRFEIKEK